jgi:hypothetical protein
MGLDTNALMTVAGGTNTADFAKNINEANVRSNLVVMNSNLLATINSTYPNKSVLQILGGWQIMPWTNALSQTSPPFPLETSGGKYPELTWTNQPTSFMSKFGISFGGVSVQWWFPQLEGQRLSLMSKSTNSHGVMQLWLDDTLVAQTNTTGSSISVTLTANHPYSGWDTVNNQPVDTGWLDASIPADYSCTNSSYAIVYCFEPDQKYLRERQDRLATYLQQGYSNSSRQVVTETLNIMGLNWMIQTKLADDLLAQQIGILPESIERVGRMAQEAGKGYYIDVYLQVFSSNPNGVNDPSDLTIWGSRYNKYFDVSSYFGSGMEHGLIQQLQNSGLTAASTIKILQLANTNHQTIYLANSTNWTAGANVLSKLVNYDTNGLNSLISQVIRYSCQLMAWLQLEAIGGMESLSCKPRLLHEPWG